MACAFIRLLEETDYHLEKHTVEQLKWFEEIKGLDKFFNWLSYAISEENCVSEDEIRMYNFLEKNNKLVPEEKLDSTLSNYMCMEEEFVNYEDEINVLKEFLETRKIELENLNILKCQLSAIVPAGNSGQRSSTVSNLLNNELKNINSLNKEMCEELESLVMSFESLHNDLMSMVKPDNNKFVCQSSFENFIDIMDKLETYVRSIKEIYFLKDQPVIISRPDIFEELENPRFIENHLNRVFEGIVEEELKIANIKAEIAGIQSVFKYFANVSQTGNKLESVKMHSIVSEVPLSINEDEFKKSCIEYVKNLFYEQQLKVIEEKNLRRANMLKRLTDFEEIVKPMSLYSDCVFLMLNNEWKWIRMSVSFLTDSLRSLQEVVSHYNSRMAWMNRLIIRQEISMANSVNNTLSTTLGQLLCTHFEDSEETAWCLQNLDISLTYYEKTLLTNLATFHTDINELLSKIKEVGYSLFPGPTKSPVFNSRILKMMDELASSLNLVKTETEGLNRKYVNFKTSLEADYYKKILHNLWLEYLLNPFKVIQNLLKFEEDADNIREHHNLIVQSKQNDLLKETLD